MKLSVVVPCFNEEEVICETAKRLKDLLLRLIEASKIDDNSGIYFVDDGSSDRTWQLIEELTDSGDLFHGVKLSRNMGHQNALIAGLENVPGDAIVSVDADLQDDIEVIEAMIEKLEDGNDIVYGVRESRSTDTIFKRWTAETYYRVLQAMGVDVVFNHADYRLLSRRALECLREYTEVNMFLRGVVPLMGFRSTTVEYSRGARVAGESKYPLGKMLALALDGITSHSAVPLRIITVSGILIFLISLVTAMWALGVRLFGDSAVPGWTSTVVPFYLLGGVQLFCLGVLGEYLAKTYLEVKRRPRYFIEKSI